MTKLHIDFETRSECDLARAGAEKYSRHPSTTVLCMAYSNDDLHPQLWRPGEPFPAYVSEWVACNDGPIAAHNAHFELAIWNNTLSRMVPNLPKLQASQLDCTMGRALAMGMPADLATLAQALRLPFQKDMAGRAAMLKLSKPTKRRDGTHYFRDDPELFSTLYAYCIRDVEVERAIDKLLPPLSPSERALWTVDARINLRGVYIDLPTVEKLMRVVDIEMDRINARIFKLTGEAISSVSQAAKLREWMNSQHSSLMPGFAVVDDLTKTSVTNAIALKDHFSEEIQEALALRQEGSKASTAKLSAMVDSADDDGRARGLLTYHGAGPGRWAGRRVQTQNMPRGVEGFTPEDAEELFTIVHGVHASKASRMIRAAFSMHEAKTVRKASVLDLISSSLRSLIMAAPTGVLQ